MSGAVPTYVHLLATLPYLTRVSLHAAISTLGVDPFAEQRDQAKRVPIAEVVTYAPLACYFTP